MIERDSHPLSSRRYIQHPTVRQSTNFYIIILPHVCLFSGVARRHGKRRPDKPIRVVNAGILAKQLLLASLVGIPPTHLVAVLLGLEEGDEMDTRPHLLAGQFAGKVERNMVSWRFLLSLGGQIERRKDVLSLPDTLDELVPSEAHDGAHAEEEEAGAEAAHGEVALVSWLACVSFLAPS